MPSKSWHRSYKPAGRRCAVNSRREASDEELSPIETIEGMLRAAGNYVVPSDDLRPRILEAAREYRGNRRSERRLAGYALTTLLLWVLCLPLVDDLDVLRSKLASPSAFELQQRALEITADKGFDPNWAMAEVFTQLRHTQAELFGNIRHR